MRVFFDKRVELCPTVWEYYFRLDEPLAYLPGQYLTLDLPQAAEDSRGSSRTLTITSLPSDDFISFVIRIPAPCSLYKQNLAALLPGDEATVGDALGDLVLPKDPTQPLVFVAGGIGIASFAGMLKQLIADKQEREIYLFYSLKARKQQLYRELTAAYPLALTSVSISPHRLTATDIIASTPPEALFYVSGSQTFVEQLCIALVEHGVPRTRLIFDYFDGYAEL